jgi:transposase
LLPIDLARQLVPGTFAYALNHLLDSEIDLSGFDKRFKNDDTGAFAYPPAMLLKVVLFAYSQGIVSSRSIERACQEQVTFIALTGDSAPHFTTIAKFISTLGDDISWVFTQVLFVCDGQGLIGRQMFAIDGVKLPQVYGVRLDISLGSGRFQSKMERLTERRAVPLPKGRPKRQGAA